MFLLSPVSVWFPWFYCILSYVDFGPRNLSRRKGRSHDYRLLNWAEVNAWSVVSVHFGRFDTTKTNAVIETCFLKILSYFHGHSLFKLHLVTRFKRNVWLRPFFKYTGSSKSILKRFQVFLLVKIFPYLRSEAFFNRLKSGRSLQHSLKNH